MMASIEPMLMIVPPLFSLCFIMCWHIQKTELRLMSMIFLRNDSSTFRKGLVGYMPALFTRISGSFPFRVVHKESISSLHDKSTVWRVVSAWKTSSFSLTLFSLSSLMSTSCRLAPASANLRAMASPIPVPEPVINAFLFFSDMSSDIGVMGDLSFLFMRVDAPWFYWTRTRRTGHLKALGK